MVPDAVQNQVVMLPISGEVLVSVINNPIRTKRSHHIQIPCTAYTGDIRAKGFGDLHSEGTHTSGRAVNQYLVSRLNVSLVAEALERGESRHWYGSRLLECHISGLCDQCRLGSTYILGKGAAAGSKYLVAGLELCDLAANQFDLACNIDAEPGELWPAQPGA